MQLINSGNELVIVLSPTGLAAGLGAIFLLMILAGTIGFAIAQKPKPK